MWRTVKSHFLILTITMVLAGSAACMRAEPVPVTPAASSLPGSTAAAQAQLPAGTPLPAPTDTPIPASSFQETYFRREGDPPETLIRDSEHGHWGYRADALDVRVDCITADLGRGNATYFVVHIHVRNGEDLRSVAAENGRERPWRLARENKAVLLLSGSADALRDESAALMIDGETIPGVAASTERGVDARAAIGEVAEGHYLAVVADGRQPGYSVGLTLSELADVFAEHGAWTAYRLADGRETALVLMGEQLNRHAGRYAGSDPSYQARISEAVAFGESARVPKVTDAVENDGNG